MPSTRLSITRMRAPDSGSIDAPRCASNDSISRQWMLPLTGSWKIARTSCSCLWLTFGVRNGDPPSIPDIATTRDSRAIAGRASYPELGRIATALPCGLTRRQPLALEQHRIAELVRPITVRVEHSAHAAQRRLGRECAQQLVVAGAGLVRPGEDRIDDDERSVAPDALIGDARANDTVFRCRVLERAHDGRADRHDAPARGLRTSDRARGHRRNRVRLVERQPGIERGIAGRREAG